MILAKSTFSYFAGSAAIAAAIGYLGSVPTAGGLGRLGGVDLRKEGSGNPGTANALRRSGPLLAATVLVVEAGKGYAAVLVGDMLVGEVAAIAGGLGAIAGNVYNVWYGFQGGKGLGITFGVLVALWPAVLLPLVAVLVVALGITRSSELATLIAIAALVGMAVVWSSHGWSTGGIATGNQLLVSCPVGPVDISASSFCSWQGRTTKAHWPFVEAEDAARGEKGR